MLENIGIMDHPLGTYAKFSKKTNISFCITIVNKHRGSVSSLIFSGVSPIFSEKI